MLKVWCSQKRYLLLQQRPLAIREWLFLGTAASSLLSTAAHAGGTWSAVVAALALAIGLAIGDGMVVLFGGLGVRRAGELVVLWVHRGLATVLVALGVGLMVNGVVS